MNRSVLYEIERGYVRCPNSIILDHRVTDFAQRLYLFLKYKVKSNNWWQFKIFPLRKALSRKLDENGNKIPIGEDKVREALLNLEKTGWIEIKRAKGKQNQYIIHDDPTLSTDEGYIKLEKLAKKSLADFATIISTKIHGFDFSVPMSYFTPFGNANEHIHFTADIYGKYEHSVEGIELTELQQVDITRYLFEERFNEVITFIKQNRR